MFDFKATIEVELPSQSTGTAGKEITTLCDGINQKNKYLKVIPVGLKCHGEFHEKITKLEWVENTSEEELTKVFQKKLGYDDIIVSKKFLVLFNQLTITTMRLDNSAIKKLNKIFQNCYLDIDTSYYDGEHVIDFVFTLNGWNKQYKKVGEL